jgi:hypothetical protein
MGKMVLRTKTLLGHTNFTSLYDKGYHTGSAFKTVADLGIEVLVAIPTVAANAPNHTYNVENFEYNSEGDFYICPQGKELHTTGTLHEAKTYKFKRYTTRDCMSCPVKSECTKAKYGKGIQRSEYQEYINKNKERILKNQNYYPRRQAIVEHPYGTIKRQWGFNYVMTKQTIHRASADVGLVFTAYNLRRILNIVGKEALRCFLFGFLMHIALFLASLELFWRTQKKQSQKLIENLRSFQREYLLS